MDAACGLAGLATVDLDGSYWSGIFPSVCILAVGMTVTVAPLTATVMSSIGGGRAGLASGVNNAVARVGGLFAVAVMVTVLFASFSNHIGAVPRMHAADPLKPVMSRQSSTKNLPLAPFRH